MDCPRCKLPMKQIARNLTTQIVLWKCKKCGTTVWAKDE